MLKASYQHSGMNTLSSRRASDSVFIPRDIAIRNDGTLKRLILLLVDANKGFWLYGLKSCDRWYVGRVGRQMVCYSEKES